MAIAKKSSKSVKPAPAKAKDPAQTATRVMAPVSTPAPAFKPVAPAAKPAARPSAPSARVISQAERQRMIEEAAYFRAERENFTGDPDLHWSDAEKEVDVRLARENVRVA